MKKKKQKHPLKLFLKTIVILISFIFLLFVSEILFIFNNAPEQFAPIFLRLGKHYLKSNDPRKVLGSLDIASYFYLKQSKNYYHDLIPDVKIRNNHEYLRGETKGKIFDLLNSSYPVGKVKETPLIISNIYYNIALVLHNDGYYNPAYEFLNSAIHLQPELSFLHVELANMYFRDGDHDKGTQALEYCFKFESPKKHCREYLERNVRSNAFEPIGVFKEILPGYQGL